MDKLKIMLPAVVAAGSLLAWPAYAHGFGERTELPVPLGYFLIGAALAVALSFVFISILFKINQYPIQGGPEVHTATEVRRFNSNRPCWR